MQQKGNVILMASGNEIHSMTPMTIEIANQNVIYLKWIANVQSRTSSGIVENVGVIAWNRQVKVTYSEYLAMMWAIANWIENSDWQVKRTETLNETWNDDSFSYFLLDSNERMVKKYCFDNQVIELPSLTRFLPLELALMAELL